MNKYFVPAGSFIDLSDYSSNLGALTSGSGLSQCPTCGRMTGTIDVQFKKTGAVYRYYHTPPALWEFILNGKTNMDTHDKFSIGVAFHNEVISKKDIYHYERVT